MSVSIEPRGGQGSRSVDVDLNLVPFIDMMSCLVAFLLITAVWTNLAEIRVNPKAAGATSEAPAHDVVAVLITKDGHWLGRSEGGEAARRVGLAEGARDWQGLDEALAQVAQRGLPLEVAAEEGVDFQTIIATMDHALAFGLDEVAYVDPGALSVHFSH
jgi:biopolymer transport protein TolR